MSAERRAISKGVGLAQNYRLLAPSLIVKHGRHRQCYTDTNNILTRVSHTFAVTRST